jgi:ABC-type multidrug transport system fused ATPase/permease subunit
VRARHRYVDVFLRYVAPEWRRVIVLGLLIAASIALQLVAPQLLRSFIDNAIADAVGTDR